MEQLLALGSVVKVQVSENKKDALRMVVCGYFPHEKNRPSVRLFSGVVSMGNAATAGITDV